MLLVFLSSLALAAASDKQEDPEAPCVNPLENTGESTTRFAVCVALLCLLLTFTISHYTEHVKHISWLPESTIAVVIGIIFSGIFYGIQGSDVQHITDFIVFDKDIFFLWLLPPIIFESGYNLKRKEFFENIGPTLLLAFAGTLLSTFVVGGIVYAAGAAGFCQELRLLPSLVFGALISATDPVTVLSVFQSLGVDINLFSMVFGESVLNDAVALVLYRTLVGFKCEEFTSATIFEAMGLFLEIFILSFLIGVAAGVLSAVIFKRLNYRHSEHHVFTEAILTIIFPWTAYFFAEAFELSGIVAILFCGVTMAHYTYENLSQFAQDLTRKMYKVLAGLAETFVFVYLGFAVFSFTDNDDKTLAMLHHTKIRLVVIAICACLLARAMHVIPICWLVNKFRQPTAPTPAHRPIPPKFTFLIWFSGLRGGVAFALAATNYTENVFPEKEEGLAILQATLYVAMFTIFFLGGSISTVARRMDVLTPRATAATAAVFDPSGLTHRGGAGQSKVRSRLLDLDRNVIMPILTVKGSAHPRAHSPLPGSEGQEDLGEEMHSITPRTEVGE